MSGPAIHEVTSNTHLPAPLPIKRRRGANRNMLPKARLPLAPISNKRTRKARSPLTSRREAPSASAPISLEQVGHPSFDPQPSDAGLLSEIKETHRRRQDFHRAEKSLTNQIKAIGRRLSGAGGQNCYEAHKPYASTPPPISGGNGHLILDTRSRNASAADLNGEQEEGHSPNDAQAALADLLLPATAPLIEARAVIKSRRLEVERKCQKLAKQLPVWPWVEAINGFGPLGLAQIVGETGDLSLYANPGKVWKRMGLAVFNGKSQRRVKGEAAIEQGYSPRRRAIMFCIGDSLLKKQNQYRELYLARKVTEQEKVPDGTKMLWHRRAQRYAEKRLLRDLWTAWRAA